MIFFFKQKTAYEMRISNWSSDVCSSDFLALVADHPGRHLGHTDEELRGADAALGLGHGHADLGVAARHGVGAPVVGLDQRDADLEVEVDDPPVLALVQVRRSRDRKSTRLNSSH